MAHPIENVMRTTMEELRQMVDVNTIIGDPIMMGNDTVIVPVSRVSLGFLSGGGEYGSKCAKHGVEHPEENKHPFIGASAAGMSLVPMAFLAITDGVVRVLPADYNCTIDRVVELVPESLRQLERVVRNVCDRRKQAAEQEEDTTTTMPEA